MCVLSKFKLNAAFHKIASLVILTSNAERVYRILRLQKIAPKDGWNFFDFRSFFNGRASSSAWDVLPLC
jgi:hypothetical protein